MKQVSITKVKAIESQGRGFKVLGGCMKHLIIVKAAALGHVYAATTYEALSKNTFGMCYYVLAKTDGKKVIACRRSKPIYSGKFQHRQARRRWDPILKRNKAGEFKNLPYDFEYEK